MVRVDRWVAQEPIRVGLGVCCLSNEVCHERYRLCMCCWGAGAYMAKERREEESRAEEGRAEQRKWVWML